MARDIEHKVTQQGLALMQKALALSIPVQFTRAQLGTGVAPDADDITQYTALLTPYDNASIGDKSYSGEAVSISVQYYNQNTDSVINIAELGLFATDPDLGEILFSYTTFGAYPDKLLPIQQTPVLKVYEAIISLTTGIIVSVNIDPAAVMLAKDVTETPVPSKVLKLNQDAKLPASITGDAQSLQNKTPNDFAQAVHTHNNATQSTPGFMNSADKQALDTLNQRVNQDLTTTSKPTFTELNVGLIKGARYE